MRTLSEISMDIFSDWKKVNPAALPYLQAMSSLNSIDDSYGLDNGFKIVAYFLSNTSSWRGEKARQIKKELKEMLKG